MIYIGAFLISIWPDCCDTNVRFWVQSGLLIVIIGLPYEDNSTCIYSTYVYWLLTNLLLPISYFVKLLQLWKMFKNPLSKVWKCWYLEWNQNINNKIKIQTTNWPMKKDTKKITKDKISHFIIKKKYIGDYLSFTTERLRMIQQATFSTNSFIM